MKKQTLNKIFALTFILSATGCSGIVNPLSERTNTRITFKTLSVPTPDHLLQVQNLLNAILPANNSYDSSITGGLVVWPDEGTPLNGTVCATLVTNSLRKAYTSQGLTSTVFKAISSNKSSPNSSQFYSAFVNGVSATDINTGTSWKYVKQNNINDFEGGDLISMDYMDSDNGCPIDSNPLTFSGSSSGSGHMAIYESKNTPVLTTIPGTQINANKYEVTVLDSSNSYHGKTDTRYTNPDSLFPFVNDNGLGRGNMIFYTDVNTGAIIAHKWSSVSNNTCFPEQRRIQVARLVKF